MFKDCNRNIIIGITGGIAAYKSLSLIRLFRKEGCHVKIVATQNALQFITPLSIETLSQNKLYSDTFTNDHLYDVHHVGLADWADCIIVAPATANIIGKFANGIADDALSTLLLAIQKPIFIAPAMNEKMFENKVVQKNIDILRNQGCQFIEPPHGFLACGDIGKGRMEEPEVIFDFVMKFLQREKQLMGKKAVVTAGPTYEPIDPVRFIGNHSSGLMGFSLAEALAEEGAEVILIAGPTHLQIHHPNIQRIDVETAAEMAEASFKAAEADIIVMAAAIADYTPIFTAEEKIKKTSDSWQLELIKTTDVLSEIGKRKKRNQCIVGFALETENELEHAKSKLKNKKADIIVLNSMKNQGAGFKYPTNQISILKKNETVIEGDLKTKKDVAKDIIDQIIIYFREL